MNLLKAIALALIVVGIISCSNNNNNVKEEPTKSAKDTITTGQVESFKLINNKIKANINDAKLYLERAQLYVKYSAVNPAIKDLDRAIKIDRSFIEAYLYQAEIYKSLGKLAESKRVLDLCLKANNDNVEVRLKLGWLALMAQNYPQSLSYADAALKRDIYNAPAYYLKSIIFIQQKDTTTAISSLVTAIEQDNDYYDAYVQLGIIHLAQQNPLAKGYLKNAVRIKPNSMEALYPYALSCQQNEEYDEAIEIYQKILSIEEYKEPYFNLGYIHQEYFKVYDVAIDYYDKATDLEPSYFEAYYNKGLCYEELDQLKEAEKNYRKTLEIQPDYTYAAIALDRVLKQQ